MKDISLIQDANTRDVHTETGAVFTVESRKRINAAIKKLESKPTHQVVKTDTGIRIDPPHSKLPPFKSVNEPPKVTSLPYKLGGTDDPHFDHEAEELSRTEATCDWFDRMEAERNDFDRGDLRDEGRSDGYGESYSERNT